MTDARRHRKRKSRIDMRSIRANAHKAIRRINGRRDCPEYATAGQIESGTPTASETESPSEEIEVGDTVFYRRAKGDRCLRHVTIGRDVDDRAKCVISDNKPLARALLNATVGETVTVRQPTSKVDIVVVHIVRPESEPNALVML